MIIVTTTKGNGMHHIYQSSLKSAEVPEYAELLALLSSLATKKIKV